MKHLKTILAHVNRHRVSSIAVIFFVAYAAFKGIHGLLSPEKLIDPIILVVLEHVCNVSE